MSPQRNPGTFDPITMGHEDLARERRGLFDHVIPLLPTAGQNPFFAPTARRDGARSAERRAECRGDGFSGLLMILRSATRVCRAGLRAVSDFEYEFQLAGMNRGMYPDVEAVFLTPGEQFMFVSATIVREISVLGGDVSKFVPASVGERLKVKIRQLGGK